MVLTCIPLMASDVEHFSYESVDHLCCLEIYILNIIDVSVNSMEC